MNKRALGFTLIEMVITLVLLSLLTWVIMMIIAKPLEHFRFSHRVSALSYQSDLSFLQLDRSFQQFKQQKLTVRSSAEQVSWSWQPIEGNQPSSVFVGYTCDKQRGHLIGLTDAEGSVLLATGIQNCWVQPLPSSESIWQIVISWQTTDGMVIPFYRAWETGA